MKACGDKHLLQVGEEDGVDLRGDGEVNGLLSGAEGALVGDEERDDSSDGI